MTDTARTLRGPWDRDALPEDEAAVPRIDVGGLLVGSTDGLELTLDDAEPPVSARIAGPRGGIVLAAFAVASGTAPRPEIEAQIIAQLTADGHEVSAGRGRFGAEIRVARLAGPGEPHGLRVIHQERPGWLLRADLVYRLSASEDEIEALEDVLADTVVVRPAGPGVLRPIPLRPPTGPASDPDAGPFDAAALPPEQAALPRLDYGALRVPALLDVRYGVAVIDEIPQVVRIGVRNGRVELQAWAVPPGEQIWPTEREELRAGLEAGGFDTWYALGPFGVELRARDPEDTDREETVRFAGFDGPGWFLRASFSLDGGVKAEDVAVLEHAVRTTVVTAAQPVDGVEPMAVRSTPPPIAPIGAAK